MNDIELLDATLRQIEEHPETWEQGLWRCKTGMCFAGWACALAGGTWVYPEDHVSSDYVAAEPGDDPRFVSDNVIRAAHRAVRLLGLTDAERWLLFSGTNSLEDIRRTVAEIKARKAAEA